VTIPHVSVVDLTPMTTVSPQHDKRYRQSLATVR
jgi:hypothetical protein